MKRSDLVMHVFEALVHLKAAASELDSAHELAAPRSQDLFVLDEALHGIAELIESLQGLPAEPNAAEGRTQS